MEGKKKTVSKEQVITKLKDDGDFDNLRLSIIRKLKDNEELRNSIISVVRQSAALNRAGAENMKPRQLSDAIYDEVGNEVMSKLSDGVWEIIRSAEGMKNEITETVQSVYNKLVEPETEVVKSSMHGAGPVQMEACSTGACVASVAPDGNLSDGEPPPGFSLSSSHQSSHKHNEEWRNQGTTEEKKEWIDHSKDTEENAGHGAPPGYSVAIEKNQLCDNSDEDPDVPPGFG